MDAPEVLRPLIEDLGIAINNAIKNDASVVAVFAKIENQGFHVGISVRCGVFLEDEILMLNAAPPPVQDGNSAPGAFSKEDTEWLRILKVSHDEPPITDPPIG